MPTELPPLDSLDAFEQWLDSQHKDCNEEWPPFVSRLYAAFLSMARDRERLLSVVEGLAEIPIDSVAEVPNLLHVEELIDKARAAKEAK